MCSSLRNRHVFPISFRSLPESVCVHRSFAPALAVAALTSTALTSSQPAHAQATTVPPVTVEVQRTKPKKRAATRRTAAPRIATAPVTPAPFTPATPEGISTLISAASVPAEEIVAKRASTSDTAALLSDVPGVSLYGAGGISSLPVIHGLADDRLRIKVDGMDLIGSCPNHMNPALSYIDPNQVGAVKVWTGATPVSVGGDAIGGTIAVDTAAPVFAAPGQGTLTKGNVGAFYRSNGNVRGANLSTTMATENVSISYSGAFAKADNYMAGGNFKNFSIISTITPILPANEVGSSAYETRNHQFNLAWRKENHLVEFKFGHQHIPYQLYPNQRMDMLDNKDYRFNLRYLGKFDWGNLEARAYHQIVDHYMDFGKDKLFWYGGLLGSNGTFYPTPGMPMYTKSKTTGASAKADINLNARDLIRVGFDAQTYRLDDWWPPAPDCGVGICQGGMAPLTFWNINNGQRDRIGVFSEWEAKWNRNWLSLLGVRFDRVHTNTGVVQGYNSMMYTTSSVGTIGDFNAMDRSRAYNNVDLSAILKHTPNANLTLELGLVQKTRAPNLYELYSWSRSVMALEMNNFVGDGNGYLGNPFLKSEIAHTVSFTGAWRSANRETEIKITPYYTHVTDYIDAVQWNRSTNIAASPTTPNQFVIMKYMNQNARLYGFDLSGKMPLGTTSLGTFGLRGVLSYTNGRNLVTGDGLYNIMPLNAKLMLTHKLGGWDNGIELVAVANKYDVSAARNELRLPGYSLINLRSSYAWKKFRVTFGVENVLNQSYYLPLGGAYVGEGATMSFNKESGTVQNNGVPPASHGASGTATMWGTAVPGPGRSFYVAANMEL